jgi:hypothetical protein
MAAKELLIECFAECLHVLLCTRQGGAQLRRLGFGRDEGGLLETAAVATFAELVARQL